jgi:hypothetical protein
MLTGRTSRPPACAIRVLGIWATAVEGVKAWAQALAQLRNPGPGGGAVRLLRWPVRLGEEITRT